MSVGRICVREVDVCEPEETVRVAAQRMHSRMVGTLVVLDQRRQPVGIITDRDLTIRVLALGKDPFDTIVGEVMTSCPETVEEDTPIESALAAMRKGPFRRVPVVDEEGKLVGLLSVDDILDLLSQEFQEIGRLLQEENPSRLSEA